MKPRVKLAEAKTADGARLALHAHDGHFGISVNGQELMHSALAASELQLGELAMARVPARGAASVLIGGLGLGFTLKSVRQHAGPKTEIVVAELVPEVVAWNREFLRGLNGALLDDARVKVEIADVWNVIARAGAARFDAIILDIDNGPEAMVQPLNRRVYERGGIERIAAALKPEGRLVVWSAGRDSAFERRLTEAGFKLETVAAKRHATAKRCAYTIYIADR